MKINNLTKEEIKNIIKNIENEYSFLDNEFLILSHVDEKWHALVVIDKSFGYAILLRDFSCIVLKQWYNSEITGTGINDILSSIDDIESLIGAIHYENYSE